MNKNLAHYYRHRERRIQEMRESRNAPRIRASSLLSGARKRALKAGIEFSLDLEWVAERVCAGRCEVSGIPFVFQFGRHAFAPSLDRIDPTKGYTKDNVQVVVWCYNAAKGVGTHENVLDLSKALVAANDNEQRTPRTI